MKKIETIIEEYAKQFVRDGREIIECVVELQEMDSSEVLKKIIVAALKILEESNE